MRRGGDDQSPLYYIKLYPHTIDPLFCSVPLHYPYHALTDLHVLVYVMHLFDFGLFLPLENKFTAELCLFY